MMSLRQVNTACADLLPQECDGIQPDELCTLSDVKQQDIQYLKEHVKEA